MNLRLSICLLFPALSACQSTKITDPKTGVVFEQTTVLMRQGPKNVTINDGDRKVVVQTGEKDQTAVANKLIELGQSLKSAP